MQLPQSVACVALGAMLVIGIILSGVPGCDDGSAADAPCDLTLADALSTREIDGLDSRFLDVSYRPLSDGPNASKTQVIVDLAPVSRGEHRALRVVRERTCALSSTPLPAIPAVLPDAATAGRLGLDAPPQSSLAALVMTGSDTPAATADDTSAWNEVFRTLRVGATHLHAPSRADALETLMSACGAVDQEGTLVLITAGRATPAGRGAFLLGAEAISYAAMVEVLADECPHVGLLVWVIDAAYAGRVDLSALEAMPTMVWRASSETVPDAARIGVERGGALSATLAKQVSERAASACLDAFRPQAAEVARVFGGQQVRASIVETRWRSIGIPAVADAVSDGQDQPQIPLSLAQLLDAQVPDAAGLLYTSRAPEEATRCVTEADCRVATAACQLAACRVYRCEAGQCVQRIAVGSACDDGNACSQADQCVATGQCEGSAVPCVDEDPCTADFCDPALGCAFPPASPGTGCDDGDACTDPDQCDGLGTCGGNAVLCSDGDPCTLDRCDAVSGCVYPFTTVACDDGNPCTRSDVCRTGVCAGSPVACDDGNGCTADRCDASTGLCGSVDLAEGAPCDDFDPCTLADRCLTGVCGGLPKVCDDGLSCTFDQCAAGVCEPLAIPGFCVSEGTCVAVGDTPPDNPCSLCVSTGRLEPNPVQANQPCAGDGIACTEDICQAGRCAHPLSLGTCLQPEGTCVAVGESITECLRCADTGVAEALPDGTPCNADGSCVAGICIPSPDGPAP